MYRRHSPCCRQPCRKPGTSFGRCPPSRLSCDQSRNPSQCHHQHRRTAAWCDKIAWKNSSECPNQRRPVPEFSSSACAVSMALPFGALVLLAERVPARSGHGTQSSGPPFTLNCQRRRSIVTAAKGFSRLDLRIAMLLTLSRTP